LYGLTLRTGKCTDPNCLSQNGDFCSSCAAEYRINSNGVCEFNDINCALFKGLLCETCKTGFNVNARGICIRLPQNCRFANFQIDNVCITCSDGFSVTANGGCIAIQSQAVVIANCAVVQNRICSRCNPGFVVQNNACSKVSILCGTNNSITGLCLTCITGYTLINGICYDLNCLNQVEERCFQCKTNFRITASRNICSYFDPNCASLTTTGC